MHTVAIIGAGPCGNYLGYLLAKNGHAVTIYEENIDIGKPIQCTGILTSSIKNHLTLSDEFVVNQMNYVEVFSQHNYFKAKCDDIIVDRTLFDQHIGNLAKQQGAVIKTGHKFLSVNNGKLEFKVHGKIITETGFTHLIGADGPNSPVSKLIGNKQPQFYLGKQGLARGRFQKDLFQVFLGNDIAPKFFGWSVPENEEFSRIGIATLENPGKYFDMLLQRMKVDKKDIVEFQGGLIPIYDPNVKLTCFDAVHKLHLAVVGDAALQVKATTGGGIIPGMEAAAGLARALHNNTCYENEIKNVTRELKLHLLIRKMLDKFDNKDYDTLVKLLNQERLKQDLLTITRDNAKKLAIKLLLKEPRLALFARKLLF
ncbi:NAD(P)/FAD-dependent oxidoreductase [Candidatus Woesearchaeota archaeon]|nr:NAD(P)/FAD-dependent oxidoreductase [Candidatus Woesearchaeota archaeon]